MKTNVANFGRFSTMALSAVFAGFLFCVLPQNVMAQQTTKQTQQATVAADDEEQMDIALRKLGYVSGQAHQCQTDAAQKTKFEKTALDIANGVLRLFGSDRAFLFATAFGAGLTDKIEQKDCAEAMKRYETAIGKLKVLASK